MNKNAIQSFTQWAKIQLTSAIKQKAFEYGITEKSIDESVSVVNGRVLSQVEQKQRETLINKVKDEGYTQVIEEVTYTWFNRFIALRFMEVNGYLPTRVRVFSDENNNFNPQILKEALTIELDNINKDKVINYLDKNQTEELYKYLLISQCNALNKIIPVLFEKISNYSELLFPGNLLKKNSVIEHLVTDIPEEDWKEQVQILGWIYQFYVSGNREEFRKVKIVKKEHVPTLSQIFTPDWIVKYMTENSLGRLWLESNPNSSIKQSMKYYIEDAKQEEEVQRKLDEIKYTNVDPEDIKIIEPCCGSGHILCYIFDLLYKIYEECGYRKSEIPNLILEKNIYGLDIDKRASQLAYFSLLMKARSVDNRFFSRDKFAKPKVFEIVDSQNIIEDDYEKLMFDNKFSHKTIEIAKYLVNTFKNAKVIGSLLKVDKLDYKYFIEELKLKRQEGQLDFFSSHLYNNLIPEFIKLARLAIVLSKKYDVMITNPPYIGTSTMEKSVKDYANDHYTHSKSNTYSMFIETEFIKNNGFKSLVIPDAWMFSVNYEKVRHDIIRKNHLINMIHLGNGIFDATVQTTSFVLRECKLNKNSVFVKLIDEKEKEALFLSNYYTLYFYKNISEFKLLPGMIFAYWTSETMVEIFKKGICLKNNGDTRQGMFTSDNNRFLRLWFEVEILKIGFEYINSLEASNSKNKWFPYNKGGEFRKWYGNQDYLINYENDGYEVKEYAIKLYKTASRTIKSMSEYFKKCISWSRVSGENAAFRYYPEGFVFDGTGCCIFYKDEIEMFYNLGFLNSKVSSYILKAISPTLNTEAGQIAILPIIENQNKNKILLNVEHNINIAKNDWDSLETSWDFKKHPLI